MNNKNDYLSTEDLSKLIWKFSLPAIISGLVGALYNIADQIFIGQSIGVLGNAATNIAFPLTTISTGIALLLGIGTASNYNLRRGQKRDVEAGEIMGAGISLIIITGLLLAFLIFIFLTPLLNIFGATDKVFPYALTYTSITTFGLPFYILSTSGSFLIRADGSPKYAMFATLTGAIINVVLDPIFIFLLDMGIMGAALATIIGQIISGFIIIVYFIKYKNMDLKKDYFKVNFYEIKKISALGASACFNQIAVTIVQITMNNTLTYYGELSKYGSEIPLATVGIVTKLNILIISVIIGIAQGCQPIFSYNYGAKNYKRVKNTMKKAFKYITTFTVLAFFIIQLFPAKIISLFGNGNELYFEFATRYLRVFMFFTFLNGIQPLSGNFFASIGKAQKGMLIALTRQILFLMPLIILLPKFFGIEGVIFAGPIADFAAILVSGYLVLKEFKILDNLSLSNN
ncbi:MAG: MATE family efflux transporter [Tissierellia bacterium]|nr:MATE family efflux transporter [Tissierellia bacterium]